MSERYYINSTLGPGSVLLEGQEAHHLAAVCRVRPGDAVVLFNGDGLDYPAEVVAVYKRSVEVNVGAPVAVNRELPLPLEVAAPLPRGDRGQFLIEKLTELGVHAFIPLRTQHSGSHSGEMKHDKLVRYVIEASKQCGRNVLMEIRPVTDWSQFIATGSKSALRIVGHPGAAKPSWRSALPILVAVGPEGGFTDDEITSARDQGWEIAGLGPRILRVETAALVLAASAAEAIGG